MVSVAELVLLITGKDEASKTIGGVKGALSGLEKPMLAAGAAASAAGIGIDALARSQQDSNTAVQQNAAALGISEGAYRKLALSISEAGLPLDDINSLFTTARQEGLTGGEDLKKYAKFWDDVGDATGKSATDLAQAASGLRAVGIAAGQEDKALAAFGFVTDHTKLGVDEFLNVLTKKGADIKGFGLNINDSAALLALLEKNTGLSGRALTGAFASAIEKSDGTLDSLLQNLGVTKDQFAAMQGQVEQSGGVIERNAAIQDANITSLERWKYKIKEFTFAHADLIKGLSEFAPILTAAGPATALVSGALRSFGAVTKIAAAAQWLLNAAMLANPAILIVVGIVALVAILVVLEMKFGLVSTAVGLAGQAFTALLGVVTGALSSVLNWANEHWPEIATILTGPFAPIVALATDAFGVRSAFTGAISGALGFVTEHWPEIVTILSGPFAPIVALATDSWGVRTAFVGALGAMLTEAQTWGGNILTFFTNLPGNILTALGDISGLLFNAGKSLIQGFINGMKSIPIPNPLDLVPGGGLVKGALSHIPGRAIGGPVTAGAPYVVGENGPELFVPRQSGNVIPGKGFGGLTVNFNGPVHLGGEKDQLQTVGFAVATSIRARGVPFLP